MSKQIATDQIANELKGSAWFKRPAAPPEAESPAPPETDPAPSAPMPVPAQSPATELPAAHATAAVSDGDASMHARKHASKQASIQASMHARMQPYLSEKATDTYAFRYPPALLEHLADALHVIRKQHRRKLTKNAIAVAALAFLLTDFDLYGEESVLYQLLIQQEE